MKTRIGIMLMGASGGLLVLRAFYLFGSPYVVDGGLVAAVMIGLVGLALWAIDDQA